MSGWTPEELAAIGEAVEVQVASVRVDAAYRNKYRGWGAGLERITRPLAAATASARPCM
jgi:hypothetical protein